MKLAKSLRSTDELESRRRRLGSNSAPTLPQPLLSYGCRTSSLKDAIAMAQSGVVIDNAVSALHRSRT